MRQYYTKRNILICSFLLPLAVMILTAVILGVEPFGGKSLVIIDGLHQYMPFYSVLYDKLRTGGSFFYSFRAGLGINFMSLMAYYLSSPLNLVILLFKRTQLNMAVSWLIVLKLALSGLAAGIYFSSKTRKPDIMVLVCAAAYSMNSYMVGYCWNVMWLDALMIFPIIMLGLEKLVEKGDGRLYCVSLFYALFCNYYIAYMICIFCVIWFAVCAGGLIGREGQGFRAGAGQVLRRGLTFAFCSLLAAGLAAVILLPAYDGIRQTAAGESFSLPAAHFQTSFADLINRQIDLSTPVSHDNFDGNANLYVGIFSVITFFLYMFNRKISPAKTAVMLALCCFFYMSFAEERLNFIWHGFHDQYGIPNRFSFLLGFLLICMFYEVMQKRDGITAGAVTVSCILCTGMVAVSQHLAENPLPLYTYGLAGMLAVFYSMLLFLRGLSVKRKYIYSMLFALTALVEISGACLQGFSYIGQIDVNKFFRWTEDMTTAVREDADGTFYRSEMASAAMVDEAVWYPMNTVGLFGSTARSEMVDIMDALGFSTGCNEYLYKGDTALTNLLFGVRRQYFKKTDEKKTEFVYSDSYGEIASFENPAKSSVGYMVDQGALLWTAGSDYPLRVQNELAYHFFGIRGLYHNIIIPDPETHSTGARRTNDGEYFFELESVEEDNFVFRIPIEEDAGTLYFHFDGSEVSNTRITLGGEYVREGDLDGAVISCGPARAGDLLEVTMMLKGDSDTGYIRLSAASMDTDHLTALRKKMSDARFLIREASDGRLRGTARAGKEGGILFFSIPYDEGWHVTVDGRPAETCCIGQAFLGVELEEGDHDVSLKYTPPGFRSGALISILSLLIFLGWLIMYKIRYKKEKKNL